MYIHGGEKIQLVVLLAWYLYINRMLMYVPFKILSVSLDLLAFYVSLLGLETLSPGMRNTN